MMTEDELDQVHELREQIEAAVTKLVGKMLADAKVPEKIEDLVRTQLTENYRFWKD
jgi:DNA-binding GntR family transcriptional regulator